MAEIARLLGATVDLIAGSPLQIFCYHVDRSPYPCHLIFVSKGTSLRHYEALIGRYATPVIPNLDRL